MEGRAGAPLRGRTQAQDRHKQAQVPKSWSLRATSPGNPCEMSSGDLGLCTQTPHHVQEMLPKSKPCPELQAQNLGLPNPENVDV